MPNWTWNELTVTKKVYEAIATKTLNYNKEEIDSISFAKLIPEPKTKDECLEKYGPDYIIEDTEHSHLQSDEGMEWFNWYAWHCDYWGTKWDAADVEVYIMPDENEIGLYFNTAWAPPEKFFEVLCETFPDEKITGYAEEEANLFKPYRWENQNGHYTITEELEPEWYEEDDYEDEGDTEDEE